MKTLLLFLALSAPMLAQDTQHTVDSLGTLMARVASEPRTWTHECAIRIIAPSGREIGWTKERRTVNSNTVPGELIIQRDSVLRFGCPTCGSDKILSHGAHSHKRGTVMREFVTYVLYGCGCSDFDPADWGTGKTRVSICAECGTIYHGRRK